MNRKPRINVDVVAFTLAISLGLGVILIMVAVLIQVLEHQEPVQTLGENTTQVLTAIIGGLIGVLGGYVGARVQQRHNGNGENGKDKSE
jgi:H+/Cl- antiporter ClcA